MAGAVATERKTFDLATKTGRSEALKVIKEGDDADINDFVSLSEYVRSGEEPAVKHGKGLFFKLDNSDEMVYLLDGVIYRVEQTDGYSTDNTFESVLRLICDGDYRMEDFKSPLKQGMEVIGFLVESRTKGYAHSVLKRGDEDHNPLVDELNEAFPTFSLSCMAQMFGDDDSSKSEAIVTKKFIDKKLSVVDFLPDERKALTAAERKQLTAYNQEQRKAKPNPSVKPPLGKPGFSLVDTEWHRSSTIVFHDSSDDTSYIFGQDEGTYFGCKLADNPESVVDAFTSLIPLEARGKPFKRQGEWFAVPVKQADVPDVKDSIILPDGCALPILEKESNLHTLTFERDDGNGDFARMAKDGTIFAPSGYLEHDEHASLHWKGWVRFYRNTALKSVSADANVD